MAYVRRSAVHGAAAIGNLGFPFPPRGYPLDLSRVEDARSSWQTFLHCVGHAKETQTDFAVLLSLPDMNGGGVWIDSLRFDGAAITGQMVDARSNSRLEVRSSEVLDWLYVHNHRLVGARTFRRRLLNVKEVYGRPLFSSVQRNERTSIYQPLDIDLAYASAVEKKCYPLPCKGRERIVARLFDAIADHDEVEFDRLLSDENLACENCTVVLPGTPNVVLEHLPALLYAINEGNKWAAERLICAGADLAVQSERGHGPLHTALSLGGQSPHWIDWLVEAGCQVDGRSSAQWAAGWTALTMAANSNRIEAVRSLLSNGADADDYYMHEDGSSGQVTVSSPSLADIMDVRIAEMLHQNGARFDRTDNEGRTPLHIAVFNASFEVAEFLLDIGCDPNALNKAGRRVEDDRCYDDNERGFQEFVERLNACRHR